MGAGHQAQGHQAAIELNQESILFQQAKNVQQRIEHQKLTARKSKHLEEDHPCGEN
jgi:hypothetical protein